jgi:NADH dehydrogenase
MPRCLRKRAWWRARASRRSLWSCSSEQAVVFGPGRNPINFVSARDVAALVDLAVHDPSLRGQILEVAGPENLTFTELAERLIAASGQPGRIRHVPLPMLRVMSLLARPVSPMYARQAQAAVVMNTTDMRADLSTIRDRCPTVPATTLDEVLGRQPPGSRLTFPASCLRLPDSCAARQR